MPRLPLSLVRSLFDQLSRQLRDDINRTITKSMLSHEVLNELNASGEFAGYNQCSVVGRI